MAIIRVSGNLGSGKTTLCNRLAEHLGYKNYYTGNIFRQLAKEKELSIEEFYKELKSNPGVEKEVDNRQIELMMSEDNLVVQGRMAPFQPSNPNADRINVFIQVSDEEGARRQLKRKENEHLTFEHMLELSRERAWEETERYRNLYGINNYLDQNSFDIIIDTTNMTIDEAFQALLEKVDSFLNYGF
ncbi:MAG: hypothetical protein A3B91_01760 [Candidatus Yanofskybacteria bacterium RIFCSPHIGHO2_02_FULL_41_29]|uniref:(d)CMP kinase n=1 Tax=Candidatus Yanofskybacteria bacterium RIFCSPHIGHO2_01_FULL_41_53 TaxID=1802663 RepID=A0A1F8EJQ4_9BACT|nr:MAG: hypothetical protein A2650_03190 [Candidatus Yanofskybacteria bacterium RIFCSPHIGHO2_01_FULL_41_53]OGN11850.1 MAG: hypothetical protein A3B91_01760 [Candidatus Yanofskybacteria bacterium RIFCSPHIGHO2_02_FULL_41_29]OGN17246.1 MAG: hypothetical protein A3F48_03510 [Candidatus Yanofskybacteria bacterium RIFCSPHIGHO2_12_FULL_41_9]OGN23098.1 MAG: hypothetical protein A2916_05110 [Candidatus Yanofskybacteria bacterium RIFCSPLOWO2_01_FULL_41_67]OGN29901.1 MAG: hypothetical protein A3H54_03865 